MIEQIATLNYRDQENNSEACLIIRKCDNLTALCITIKGENDIETFLFKDVVENLIDALQRSISQ